MNDLPAHEQNQPFRAAATGRRTKLDFVSINERAMSDLEAVIGEFLKIDLKVVGNEIQMLNPRREDYEFGSFSINSETGVWADFASPNDKGGDVISLVAYIKGVAQGLAAKQLRKFLDDLAERPRAPAHDTLQPAGASRRAIAAHVGKHDEAIVLGEIRSVAKPGEPIPGFPSMAGLGKQTSYWYTDSDEMPIAVMRRFDAVSGKKSYLPATLVRNTSGQLEWLATAPKPRPLYRLDQLTKHGTATVALCEGEKAADAAGQLFPDAIATTTMNGAQSPAKTNFTALADRDVIIWPDNDDAGQAYAMKVAQLIRSCGGSGTVRILRVPMFLASTDLDRNPVLEPTDDRETGWDAADALSEGWTSGHAALLLTLPNAFALDDEGQAAEAGELGHAVAARDYASIPEGFAVNDGGVFQLKIDREGLVSPVWLASKIEVVALSTSAEGRAWGMLVRFPDPDGSVREWCVPASMFGKDMGNIWSVLSSMGATISAQPDHRTQLSNYLQQCKPSHRALSVSQPGWAGETFVFPDGTRYGQGPELICFETRDPQQERTFVPTGGLADWQASVGQTCTGNSRLVLAACIALCAPTLLLLGEENGGFHFRGPSSIGKTTSLLVATSVWGRPSRVMKRWRATANGLEGVASNHNDLLLALDEIGEITPAGAAEAAYMLANGQGKARANMQGSARAVARWRLSMISTGELSLADHLQSGGVRIKAGQEARLVDIEADAGAGFGIFETLNGHANGAELADYLKQQCDANNGVLGRAFIEILADSSVRAANIARLEELVLGFEAIAVPCDASGQVRRVAHRFAVVAAAGELAIEAGLLPWPAGHSGWAARTCFGSWLNRRGGAGELEASQAIETVRHHLQTRGDVHYQWLPNQGIIDSHDRRSMSLFGFRRLDNDGRIEHLITPDSFKLEICAGLDERAVRRHLFEAGFLVPAKDGQRTQSIRVPEIGTKRFIVINANILGEQEDATPTRSAEAALAREPASARARSDGQGLHPRAHK